MSFVLLLYLSSFVSLTMAGLVVASGSLLGLLAFPAIPHLERLHGAAVLARATSALLALCMLALALSPLGWPALLLVASITALQPLLAYQLDMLIQADVATTETSGRVRAFFLMAWNGAAILVPILLLALFAEGINYSGVFVTSAVMLVLFSFLLFEHFFPPGRSPSHALFGETLVCIVRDRDLRATTFAQYILYLFFSWATLYIPFFLVSTLGIPWSTLGWVFALMLTPYLLLAYPAGWLADTILGDKEMLGIGFAIMGASLFALGFVTPETSLVAIVSILFMSRVGAVFAESMVSGHFFRRISEQDLQSIVIFRSAWPLSAIIAPIVGSILFPSLGPAIFFMSIGVFIALAGVLTTLLIRDFR